MSLEEQLRSCGFAGSEHNLSALVSFLKNNDFYSVPDLRVSGFGSHVVLMYAPTSSGYDAPGCATFCAGSAVLPFIISSFVAQLS